MKAYFYLGLLILIFPREAHAYLDPGTGSYLLQILAAGILASLFFIKSWWRRLKNLFLKILRKDKKES
ncbi:MAG: hypothetical protein NUV73_01890 [Candidatus Daviesbacteria bacterium]|nr:hypothetical protein [Candidatus Daviesbacteria bacterium]